MGSLRSQKKVPEEGELIPVKIDPVYGPQPWQVPAGFRDFLFVFLRVFLMFFLYEKGLKSSKLAFLGGFFDVSLGFCDFFLGFS